MITPKVSDILGIINKFAPPGLTEEWDNVGLQVGEPTAPVQRIMIALDASKETVAAAASSDSNLLLTHHPLIFHPLKKINANDPVASAIFSAIKNGVAVISAHTNYDTAAGGLNDLLAARLGLQDFLPLRIGGAEELLKLVVYVPQGHEDQVLNALFQFSGFIGNYRDCSFRTAGVGTFRPMEGARPFLGKVGAREQAEEYRLEVLLRKPDLSAAIGALLKAHPYEEPAYDIYPLLNTGEKWGLGRIGRLPSPLSLDALARLVKERLEVPALRMVGEPSMQVKKVAVCSGSGAGLLKEAVRQGAQVLVTGDVRYHDAREAMDLGIAVLDAGHFATEILAVAGMATALRDSLQERGYCCEILEHRGERDPFGYL